MPNIALLNYCNLQCPYCFANEFIEEKKQQITLEQLDKILDFISKSNHFTRIGLIGGEPTLHPHFTKIIEKINNFCKINNIKQHPVLFTNGIELEQYIGLLGNINMLINLNEPEIVGEKKWQKIQNTLSLLDALSLLQNNTTLGINLYPNMKNYSYIFDIAKQYKINEIRCSVVAPTCHFSYYNNKDEYYSFMKNLFLQVIDKAIESNIKIHLDCNKIPLCYFTEKEKEKITKACHTFVTFCNPAIDITPDFKATCCFGTYDLIDLNQFKNLQEVERYFLFHDIYQKTINNNSNKCITCKQFENFTCQGGCLAFSKNIKKNIE